MKIKNITVQQYANLADKSVYDFAIKNGSQFQEPKDILNIGDITNRSFGEVKEIQHILSKGFKMDDYINYLSTQLLKSETEIVSMKLIDFYQSFYYLISEIERINKIESVALAYTPTTEEERAGIEQFSKFGNFGQFESICDKYKWPLEHVRQMKYADVFSLLYYNKTTNDFQRKLISLQKK